MEPTVEGVCDRGSFSSGQIGCGCPYKGRGWLPLISRDARLGLSSCLKDVEGSVAEAVGPEATINGYVTSKSGGQKPCPRGDPHRMRAG